MDHYETLAALQALYGDIETFDEGQSIDQRYVVIGPDGTRRQAVLIRRAPGQAEVYKPGFVWFVETGPLGESKNGAGHDRRDETRICGGLFGWFSGTRWCQELLAPKSKPNP